MSKEVRRKAKNRASVERRQQGSGLWLYVCVCVGGCGYTGWEGAGDNAAVDEAKMFRNKRTTMSSRHQAVTSNANHEVSTTCLLSDPNHASAVWTYINQQRLSAALNLWNGAFQIKRLGQQHLENLLHVDRMTCRAKD